MALIPLKARAGITLISERRHLLNSAFSRWGLVMTLCLTSAWYGAQAHTFIIDNTTNMDVTHHYIVEFTNGLVGVIDRTVPPGQTSCLGGQDTSPCDNGKLGPGEFVDQHLEVAKLKMDGQVVIPDPTQPQTPPTKEPEPPSSLTTRILEGVIINALYDLLIAGLSAASLQPVHSYGDFSMAGCQQLNSNVSFIVGGFTTRASLCSC